MDAFDEGNITMCQNFMNSAVVKYNKIIGKEGQFKGSVTSVPASELSSSSDPVVLLASALNLLPDNPIARDLVANALNAASDNE